MILSVSSIIITTIMCSFIILVFAVLLSLNFFPLNKIIKTIPFFILLIFIRLLFPIELPFTTTIRSTNFMPFIQKILSYDIILLNISIQNVLLIIWVSVIVIKLILLLHQYKKFNIAINCLPTETKYNKTISQIMNGKDTSNIKVKIMSGIASPTILGLFKPVIILPDISLNDSDVYYILSHELQHLKRLDLWRKAICELLKIIYWWNPIIGLLNKQLTMTSELNTDLAVIKNLNDKERISYLNCILNIARINKNNPNEIFSFNFYRDNKINLRKRFNMILASKPVNNSKQFVFANILLGFIFTAISYSIIFEPYILTPEITEESIKIDTDSSYIIKDGDNYHLYVDNQFLVTLTLQNLDQFQTIPMYNNESEVYK